MRDTKELLRRLDGAEVPDDWNAATTRHAQAPFEPERHAHQRGARFAAAAVAIVVSVASIWVLVSTFSTRDVVPGIPPSGSVAPAPSFDGWNVSVSIRPTRIGPLSFSEGPVRPAESPNANAWLDHVIWIRNVGDQPVFVQQSGMSTFLGRKQLLVGDWGCGYAASGPNAPVHAGACLTALSAHALKPGASMQLLVGLSKGLPGMRPLTSGVYSFDQQIAYTVGGRAASGQGLGTLRVTYTISRAPSTTPGSPGPSSSLTAVPSDPCGLLSQAQIELATGGHILSMRRLTPADLKFYSPDSPLPCAYMTDSTYGSILVTTDPAGAATYATVRDRDPAINEMLTGLGDEAFVSGKASIWVKVGDGYFSISAQMGAGDATVAMLESLARAALGSPQMVDVPTLVGLAVSDATSMLRSNGLQASITHESAPDPQGTVFRQSPAPGVAVRAGSVVDLVVSTGLPGNDLGPLDCPEQQQSAQQVYPPITLVPNSSIESVPDLIRRTFSGVQDADQITTSYSEAGRYVAVSRGNATVARVFLTPHLNDWEVAEVSWCATSGISPPAR